MQYFYYYYECIFLNAQKLYNTRFVTDIFKYIPKKDKNIPSYINRQMKQIKRDLQFYQKIKIFKVFFRTFWF